MSLNETEDLPGQARQAVEAAAVPVVSSADETTPSALATQNRCASAGERALVNYNGGSRLDQTLASDIAQFAGRFLLMPKPARWVLPIWILHTHVFDQFEFTPYLNVVSPEPGCGKSTLAKIVKLLSRKGVTPTGSSAAALKKTIKDGSPTLVLDEWDTLNADVRAECKNFLNTGYEKTGEWRIVVGGEVDVMSTFCPKAIIGRSTVALTADTQSRCVQWMMHKATNSDNLVPFRQDSHIEGEALRHRCEQWGQEFRRSWDRVPPLFPESFDLRQRDISEPLLLIAAAFGGAWPGGVCKALTTLLDDRNRNTLTPENQLLRAVKRMIQETKCTEFFWSQLFCNWANKQEDRPWFQDKPLTPAKLAEMLRVYGISPEQISNTHKGVEYNHRGYRVPWFQDAFRRYTEDAPARPLGR